MRASFRGGPWVLVALAALMLPALGCGRWPFGGGYVSKVVLVLDTRATRPRGWASWANKK